MNGKTARLLRKTALKIKNSRPPKNNYRQLKRLYLEGKVTK